MCVWRRRQIMPAALRWSTRWHIFGGDMQRVSGGVRDHGDDVLFTGYTSITADLTPWASRLRSNIFR